MNSDSFVHVSVELELVAREVEEELIPLLELVRAALDTPVFSQAHDPPDRQILLF